MNILKFFSIVLILLSINILFFKTYKNPVSNKSVDSGTKSLIFQSADNGKTWQDISSGLPNNMENYDFYTKHKELFIHSGKDLFHSKSNGSAISWSKASSINDLGNVVVLKSGMYAFKYGGGILKNSSLTDSWEPVYSNFKESSIRTIFETSSGSILIGTDKGLFKSIDSGKNWRFVLGGGWAIKVVESNNVLVATSQKGIIRSTDNGETWAVVISEGGVGIDVSVLNGGFAAISYNTLSKTRRVKTSYDAGKTWQTVDADLPPHDLIANIIQVGDYLYCGHPKGIFRSPDKGKNWELMLPAIGEKVFNVYTSGNIIYAIPKAGGC